MKERKPHPSGRPIHNRLVKGPQIWRVPDDSYVTPRLRLKEFTSAIGFTAHLTSDDEGDGG